MAFGQVFTNTGSGTTASVTVSGISAGDILVYAVSYDAGPGNSINPWPTGFTSQGRLNSTFDGQFLDIATKKADGTEGVLDALISTSTVWAALVATYTGEDQTTWIEVIGAFSQDSTANSSPVSILANSITLSNQSDVLCLALVDNFVSQGTISYAPPSGFTERADFNDGGFCSLTLSDKLNTSPGSTGTETTVATVGSNNSGWVTVLLALRNVPSNITLNITGNAGNAKPGFVNLPNTSILDFGPFPGSSDASIVVTGQAGIASGSLVEAWLRPVNTPDHSADEHLVETLKVFANTIVPGTGFTISGFNTNELSEPVVSPRSSPYTVGGLSQVKDFGGGQGTRIYGTWTVTWQWT